MTLAQAAQQGTNLDGLWTVLAALVAAGAAAYATVSARRTEKGRQQLERERLDREATDRRQIDLRAECDQCIEHLAAARRELVQAYKTIGQYQEREQEHRRERERWEREREERR